MESKPLEESYDQFRRKFRGDPDKMDSIFAWFVGEALIRERRARLDEVMRAMGIAKKTGEAYCVPRPYLDGRKKDLE